MGIVSAVSVSGQQSPSYSEYGYNPFLINSAYAGNLENTEATLSSSGMANSFNGAPRNLAFTVNGHLRNEHIGLGAGVVSDQVGVNSITSAFFAYSYKLFFDLKKNRPYWQLYYRTVVSFGLTAGADFVNEDLVLLNIQDDPNFSENINTWRPTMGLGAMLGHGNFYAGISMPNILGQGAANNEIMELSRPLYAYAGYYLFTDIFKTWSLRPSLLLKHEHGAPLQMDLNASVAYKNRFEMGLGYRTSQAINFLAGLYVFKKFRIMYNYTFSGLDAPFGNVHGILVAYRAGKGYEQGGF